MKWIAFAVLLLGLVLCAGCTSTSPVTPVISSPAATPTSAVFIGMPNLVGNWTGATAGYEYGSGYQVFGGVIDMQVVEQKGRFFSGRVVYRANGTTEIKDFAGIIGLDGKTFKTVEYPSGFTDGVIESPDEMELTFRDSGTQSTIALDSLKRIT